MKRLKNFVSNSQFKALKDLKAGPEGAAGVEIINRLAGIIEARLKGQAKGPENALFGACYLEPF